MRRALAGNPCNGADSAPANGGSGNCPYQASTTNSLGGDVSAPAEFGSSCSSRAAPRASRHATPTISFPGKERRARAHCWLGHRPACSACRSRSCSYGSLSNTVACTYCGNLGICGCAYATACLEVPRCCGQSHCELCALRACLHRYRLAANRNRPAVLSSLPWLCQCSSQGVSVCTEALHPTTV